MAAKVAGLGGKLLKGPFDVMTHGRMAVVADPEGATSMLWQPGTHPGAGTMMKDDSVMWVELAARDIEEAAAFYSGLLDGRPKNIRSAPPHISFSPWAGQAGADCCR